MNWREKLGFDAKEISYWPSLQRIAKADFGELEERWKLGYRVQSSNWIARSVSRGAQRHSMCFFSEKKQNHLARLFQG